MTLNCKVGDLAIVVKSWSGNEGRIVRCLELLPAGLQGMDEEIGPLWRVDKALSTTRGGKYNGSAFIAADCQLRPIRPLDEPETITTDNEVTA